MGSRGPVPKRSEQRRRVNQPEDGPVTQAPAAAAVERPELDEEWHPLVRAWFRSLGESGQSRFYEPSDWASARIWAEILSRQLGAERMNSQLISAWASGATELLTTEGARRRARVELVRAAADEDEAAAVAQMDVYRARFGA